MVISESARSKILDHLYNLQAYMEDSEVMHDTHHMYSGQERKDHKREMVKVSRLIDKLAGSKPK
jgi:hypothetical protein